MVHAARKLQVRQPTLCVRVHVNETGDDVQPCSINGPHRPSTTKVADRRYLACQHSHVGCIWLGPRTVDNPPALQQKLEWSPRVWSSRIPASSH